MKSVREACIPRPEVLKGDLEDSLFAADYGHVIQGRAASVYQDPEKFFRNTHPAAQLKKIITTIFDRLGDPNEAGATIRLSTGFGGGKSHTLIALWHLAQNISNAKLGTELLPAAGRPSSIAVAGIDGDKTGSTVCGRHGDFVTHSLWGELAYQLGGEDGYVNVRAHDNPETTIDAALIQDIFPENTPVLILLDELVLYMPKLSEHGRGVLLAFINSLISEVVAREQTVLVVTDPGGQAAYQRDAAALAEAVGQTKVAELDDVLGRKMTDFDPIGKEAAQVIVRRLFKRIDKGAASTASAEYYNAYQRMVDERPDLLTSAAATKAYSEKILQCFPFHPRLLETAQNRLGALQVFHKSRGTLRLFARILRDIWDSKSDVTLIQAGDLDWESSRIQSDLLDRLNRDQFKAAVDADVLGHAGQLDQDFTTDVHRRVASSLLLESIPLTQKASMDKRDLGLSVLRPSDAGHEAGDALDRLLGVCWHTYPADESHQRFQFRYEPNVNKLIEERAQNPELYEDARQSVLSLVQGYFGGHTFSLVAYPGSPRAVPDSAKIQLVLCDTKSMAQAVCDYDDDSNPEAKQPRRFRNAIFGVAPAVEAFNEAVRVMRLRLAAEQIAKEEKRRKTPLKEQVDELLPVIRKRASISAIRAFNCVVFQGRSSVTLPEKYLIAAESALESIKIKGQEKLKQFLDDNSLVYQPANALDTDFLLDFVLPGTTPSLDHEGAYSASAIHERALSHDKVRLMLDGSPIRNTLLKAVLEGKLAVRLPSGDVYDDNACVSGLPGSRERVENKKLISLNLNADVFVAPRGAACLKDWLRTDETEDKDSLTMDEVAALKGTEVEVVEIAIEGGELDIVVVDEKHMVVNNDKLQEWEPVGAAPPYVTAYTWDEAFAYAATRPLQAIKLTANNPNPAKTLIPLAQPFGATSIKLSVRVGGELKDGGQVNFLANDLKYSHALKPLDIAAKIFRAMAAGAAFEAEVNLVFNGGASVETVAKLELARDKATTGISLSADFGPEGEHVA